LLKAAGEDNDEKELLLQESKKNIGIVENSL